MNFYFKVLEIRTNAPFLLPFNIWICRNVNLNTYVEMYNQFKTLFLHKNKINSTLKNPGQKDKKRRSLEFNTCISKDRNHSRKPRINLNNAACTAIQQIHECWHKSFIIVAAAIWLEIPITKWGGFCVIKSRHDR